MEPTIAKLKHPRVLFLLLNDGDSLFVGRDWSRIRRVFVRDLLLVACLLLLRGCILDLVVDGRLPRVPSERGTDESDLSLGVVGFGKRDPFER